MQSHPDRYRAFAFDAAGGTKVRSGDQPASEASRTVVGGWDPPQDTGESDGQYPRLVGRLTPGRRVGGRVRDRGSDMAPTVGTSADMGSAVWNTRRPKGVKKAT
ncbi:hypothetical protein GCM10010336_53650 [Streptomyces goshikiensis]|nr:hypothetical protein GCM10010336_53650 [Streptomyces goshikiensis]